ncbi:MAG TPA: hypothetical protein VK348_14745, partial [Planctomycetota bacterium]|nr:hypothetical protein [Planctomycetota bacterium]
APAPLQRFELVTKVAEKRPGFYIPIRRGEDQLLERHVNVSSDPRVPGEQRSLPTIRLLAGKYTIIAKGAAVDSTLSGRAEFTVGESEPDVVRVELR